MKKNVYSLVLSEHVVNAVDRLAYQQGSNRSAMINQILAEYVSYTTPEMRVKQVLKSIENMLNETSFRLSAPSDTMLTFSSSLSYKYNPTMRYRVEVNGKNPGIGIFRAMLRTQNPILLDTMASFCRVFCDIEMRYVGAVRVQLEPGRFSRELSFQQTHTAQGVISTEELGENIVLYVRMFDKALKTYFHYNEYPSVAYDAVETVYRDYLTAMREKI